MISNRELNLAKALKLVQGQRDAANGKLFRIKAVIRGAEGKSLKAVLSAIEDIIDDEG